MRGLIIAIVIIVIIIIAVIIAKRQQQHRAKKSDHSHHENTNTNPQRNVKDKPNYELRGGNQDTHTPHDSPKPDAETAAFLKSIVSAKPIQDISQQEAFQAIQKIQGNSYTSHLDKKYLVETLSISGSNPYHLRMVSVRHRSQAHRLLDFVYYIHGGGWVIGNFETHHALITKMIDACEIAVVFIEYYVGMPHPKPLLQCVEGLKYLRQHGAEYHLDTNKCVIAGDSVGAYMSLYTLYLLHQSMDLTFIKGVVLINPVIDISFNYPSYQKYAKGFWLTRDAMRFFWSRYLDTKDPHFNEVCPDTYDKVDPVTGHKVDFFLPLDHDWRYTPNVLIVVSEYDVLHDQGMLYAQHLQNQGINPQVLVAEKTIHDFMWLAPLSNSHTTKTITYEVTKFICNKLGASFMGARPLVR